jgi:glycosyltransferase involved in cell wall biosynthesis
MAGVGGQERIIVEPAMKPTFSVVMPAFNSERTIGAAIRSLLAQTRGDFELLVVDDGSTDATVQAVGAHSSDARVRLLVQEHRGVSAARNHAISKARGTLVSMLDSDDLWMPNYLEVMGSVMDADPSAALASTDAWTFDEVKGRFKRATAVASIYPPPPTQPHAQLALLLQRNFIYTSVTVRREILLEVGPFKSELDGSEDYEMWLRVLARGYKVVRAPGVLAIHRERPGSLSADRRRQIARARDIYRMTIDDPLFPRELKPVARARMLECDARLGAADTRKSPLLGLRPHLSRLKHALLRTWLRQPPPQLRWAAAELVRPAVPHRP